MKITASVDSKLGDKVLERGKTYDIKEAEAKHILRAGLGRKSTPKAEVDATAKAAKVETPEGFEPGVDSTPASSSVTEAGSKSTTRKAGK